MQQQTRDAGDVQIAIARASRGDAGPTTRTSRPASVGSPATAMVAGDHGDRRRRELGFAEARGRGSEPSHDIMKEYELGNTQCITQA